MRIWGLKKGLIGAKMSEKDYSFIYNIYTRAVGKSVVGPGAFGIVVVGEGRNDIFGKGYFVEGYTFPCREYVAVKKALELLNGRQDKKIVLHFGEQGIVNQLNGDWGINWSLEKCAEEFKDIVGLFSDVTYENVGLSNEWIIEAKRLADCELRRF